MEQIIKFKWKDWKPTLILKHLDTGDEREIHLFDNGIALKIKELRCIGFRKNGKHFPCASNAVIESGNQCYDCVKADDYSQCVRCDGSSCINVNQRASCMANNYYIYFATFGCLLKVGMSFERRSLQRFVEQGADFAVRIAHVKDGRVARKLEQHIKKLIGAIDMVKGTQKLKQLYGDPCDGVKNINEALDILKKENVNYLIEPHIEDLRSFYRLDNILTEPQEKVISSGILLKGKVIACKGNLIFVENGEGVFSVNSHRLLGRIVETN